MKLYDIFYADGTMDSDIPLDGALREEGATASCTNFGLERLCFRGGEWRVEEDSE